MSRANDYRRANLVSDVRTWINEVSTNAGFMFSAGWLAGAAIHHPVPAFPIVSVVGAAWLQYYNLTLAESARIVVARVGRCIFSILQLAQMATGDPSPNAILFAVLIYAAVIVGISSALGSSLAIWKFAINADA